MAQIPPEVLRRLALLMLEELAAKGGRSQAKYLVTYRLVRNWLGEVADYILNRLAEGGYIAREGRYVVLAKRLSTNRSRRSIIREAHSVITQILPDTLR